MRSHAGSRRDRGQGAPQIFAASLMLTSACTTRRLDWPRGVGRITREPDPNERRGVLITPDSQRRSLVDQASASHMANEQRILGGLTEAEQRNSPTSCASFASHGAAGGR
jgi:DNA-binding MarR family transcriptional regulator